MEKKSYYWQFVRGICICAVILIHSRFDIGGGYYYLVFRNLINFPVAIFFFISGFFINVGTRDTKEWLVKRIRRLLIPYILWSLFYFSLSATMNGVKDVKYYLVALMLGNAAVPFYYIIVLALFTMVTPLLLKARASIKASCVILFSTLIIQIVGYIFLFNKINLWGWIKYTPVWIAFYYGGMLAKQKRPHIPVRQSYLMILISLLLEIAESLWMMKEGFNAAVFGQYRITGFLYSASLCIAFLSMEKDYTSNVSKMISRIGDDSFAIFFIHYIFIIVLERLIPSSVPLPLVHIIELAGCLIGSKAAITIIKMLLKSKSCYMGVNAIR